MRSLAFWLAKRKVYGMTVSKEPAVCQPPGLSRIMYSELQRLIVKSGPKRILECRSWTKYHLGHAAQRFGRHLPPFDYGLEERVCLRPRTVQGQ